MRATRAPVEPQACVGPSRGTVTAALYSDNRPGRGDGARRQSQRITKASQTLLKGFSTHSLHTVKYYELYQN